MCENKDLDASVSISVLEEGWFLNEGIKQVENEKDDCELRYSYHYALGDIDSALKEAQAALESFEPGNRNEVKTLDVIARCFKRKGMIKEAIEIEFQLLRKSPQLMEHFKIFFSALRGGINDYLLFEFLGDSFLGISDQLSYEDSKSSIVDEIYVFKSSDSNNLEGIQISSEDKISLILKLSRLSYIASLCRIISIPKSKTISSSFAMSHTSKIIDSLNVINKNENVRWLDKDVCNFLQKKDIHLEDVETLLSSAESLIMKELEFLLKFDARLSDDPKPVEFENINSYHNDPKDAFKMDYKSFSSVSYVNYVKKYLKLK